MQSHEEWGNTRSLTGADERRFALWTSRCSTLAVLCIRPSLAHEEPVTGTVKNLYALAAKENDYPVQERLQWFLSKQVEQEKKAH